MFQIEPIKIGPNQFECPFCLKIMKDGFKMRRHIMVHTGEKPISCPYCDYRCIQTSDLKKHCRNKHFKDLDTYIQFYANE